MKRYVGGNPQLIQHHGMPAADPTTIDLLGSVFPFLLFLFLFISIEFNVSFKCGEEFSTLTVVLIIESIKYVVFALLFNSPTF